MSIDIEEIKKELNNYIIHSENMDDCNIETNKYEIATIIKALEQQQAEIDARDEVIKGLIFEASTIGYDDKIIKKAEKLIGWKLS
jgi:uncharacterized protein (UPF0335 family)